MTTRNLIKKTNKFDKEYFATVVSVDDPLGQGRVQVKIDAILGDIPFWTDSSLMTGSTQFLVFPEQGDVVSVKFRNKDIYSGEWELKSSTKKESNMDPAKYGLKDKNGNCIIVDKATNNITITSKAEVVINSDTKVTINCQNCDIIAAQTCNIKAATTNLGVGGKAIARIGDTVQVDGNTHIGTITSGGTNTSI